MIQLKEKRVSNNNDHVKYDVGFIWYINGRSVQQLPGLQFSITVRQKTALLSPLSWFTCLRSLWPSSTWWSTPVKSVTPKIQLTISPNMREKQPFTAWSVDTVSVLLQKSHLKNKSTARFCPLEGGALDTPLFIVFFLQISHSASWNHHLHRAELESLTEFISVWWSVSAAAVDSDRDRIKLSPWQQAVLLWILQFVKMSNILNVCFCTWCEVFLNINPVVVFPLLFSNLLII